MRKSAVGLWGGRVHCGHLVKTTQGLGILGPEDDIRHLEFS